MDPDHRFTRMWLGPPNLYGAIYATPPDVACYAEHVFHWRIGIVQVTYYGRGDSPWIAVRDSYSETTDGRLALDRKVKSRTPLDFIVLQFKVDEAGITADLAKGA